MESEPEKIVNMWVWHERRPQIMNPSSQGEGAGTMASSHCATSPLVENSAPPCTN